MVVVVVVVAAAVDGAEEDDDDDDDDSNDDDADDDIAACEVAVAGVGIMGFSFEALRDDVKASVCSRRMPSDMYHINSHILSTHIHSTAPTYLQTCIAFPEYSSSSCITHPRAGPIDRSLEIVVVVVEVVIEVVVVEVVVEVVEVAIEVVAVAVVVEIEK